MTNRCDRVRALGCIICGNRAELHHPRGPYFETGMGVKADDKDVLPICSYHHRSGGYGVAYHAGPEAWEKNFGTQEELLAQVREELGEDETNESDNDLVDDGGQFGLGA